MIKKDFVKEFELCSIKYIINLIVHIVHVFRNRLIDRNIKRWQR